MRKAFFITIFALFASATFGQDILQGTWYNEEKTSRIQFYKQGDKYHAKVVWLKEPNDKTGKPRTDIENPDAKLRTRPLMGLIFLKNFVQKDAKTWEDGEIYDPKSGKTYDSKITMVSPKQLDIRGFIGISLIGKTTKFTKAE